MSEEVQHIDGGEDKVAEAKAVIEQEKKARAEACAKEVEAVLKKYQCKLVAFTQLQPEAL